MHKNEHRFRDAIMPDVVTDGTKRLSRYLMGGELRLNLYSLP